MYNISIVVTKTTNDMLYTGGEKASPSEVERFNKITRFKPIVMGRRTYSLVGIVPQRLNIVLSKKLGLEDLDQKAMIVPDINYILELSRSMEIFVLGGNEIFNQLLPYTNKIYLTIIDKEEKEGLFLKISEHDWEIAHEEVINNVKFQTLLRKEKLI